MALIFLGVTGLAPWGAVSTVQAASATAENYAVTVNAYGTGVLSVETIGMNFHVIVRDELVQPTVNIIAKIGKLVSPSYGLSDKLPVNYEIELTANPDEEPPIGGKIERRVGGVTVEITAGNPANVRQTERTSTVTIEARVTPAGRTLEADITPSKQDVVELTKISPTSWELKYLDGLALQESKEYNFTINVTDKQTGVMASIPGKAVNTWRPGSIAVDENCRGYIYGFRKQYFEQVSGGFTIHPAPYADTSTITYLSDSDQLPADYRMTRHATGTCKAFAQVRKATWVANPKGPATAAAFVAIAAESDGEIVPVTSHAIAASSNRNETDTFKISLGGNIRGVDVGGEYSKTWVVNEGSSDGPHENALGVSNTYEGVHAPREKLELHMVHGATAVLSSNGHEHGWFCTAKVEGTTQLGCENKLLFKSIY